MDPLKISDVASWALATSVPCMTETLPVKFDTPPKVSEVPELIAVVMFVLMAICVPLMTRVMTVFVGTFEPVIVMPATKPAVLVSVTTLLFVAALAEVFTLLPAA